QARVLLCGIAARLRQMEMDWMGHIEPMRLCPFAAIAHIRGIGALPTVGIDRGNTKAFIKKMYGQMECRRRLPRPALLVPENNHVSVGSLHSRYLRAQWRRTECVLRRARTSLYLPVSDEHSAHLI